MRSFLALGGFQGLTAQGLLLGLQAGELLFVLATDLLGLSLGQLCLVERLNNRLLALTERFFDKRQSEFSQDQDKQNKINGKKEETEQLVSSHPVMLVTGSLSGRPGSGRQQQRKEDGEEKGE